MTVAWVVARVAVVAAILTTAFLLLPPASILDTGSLTIPDYIWNPIVAVLSLNRLLPINTLLVVASLTLAIQAGMAGWWLMSWLLRHLMGGG
jgi:hypothetical protein